MKVLVSDFIGIFSDFDYDFHSGENQENSEVNSHLNKPKSPKLLSQEQFLDNYNGIIVSFENFFIMNHLEIIHIIDYKTERMKFRIGDAESQCQ